MQQSNIKKKVRKIVIAVAGGVVFIAGIIAIPYPGPGWLIVFIGLGILSTEFEWAGRVLKFARHKYDLWIDWVARQSWWVRALISCAVGAVVVVTIWLLNGYGLLLDLVHLDYPWLRSPFLN